MTFTIQEHSPQYRTDEENINVLGSGSQDQCVEGPVDEDELFRPETI